jgi:hypothetical protein
MRYVGIDLHKQSITVCVVDRDRTVTRSRCFACADTARIGAFFAALGPFRGGRRGHRRLPVVARAVEPLARRVVLTHPGKLRIIATSTRKSDRLDAGT